MVKALRSWIWMSAIVLVSRRGWVEDLSPAIGARSLRIDANRRGVYCLLWIVSLLLAETAAYGQVSLPGPGNIDTVAGYGPAGYAGDNGSATAADLNGPHNVAIDAAGDIYIADMWNNRIRKVTASTGIITTVAGNGTAGYAGDGGAATSAELYHPSGVAVDTSGNIYIADNANNRIRKVTVSTGDISTVAGNGTAGYSGDGGPATTTELNTPYDVALDISGNIYISDSNNYRVRKVTASTGNISTVAGTGTGGYTGNGGPAVNAKISQPMGLALDAAGNIYFADWGNAVIREVTVSTGTISTVAGSGSNGFSGDGGPAIAAELYYPYGVFVDTAGNIYIADDVNNRIRKVTASTGNISTVAGNGATGYSGDGGAATSAALEYPYGVALDTANNIYIADEGNNRIRAVAQVKATPSISVACSPNPITYGSQTTTCSATLSGGATGTVTWTINGGAWTTTSLSGGTTSAGGFSGWSAGTYTIGVAYGGDSNNNPVSSSTILTISKATPTVSVFCSPNPITYGGANSICTISASDSGTVSGTVSLTYNGTAWTTLPLSSGSATATWSSTSGIGTYTIGATYNGDSNNTTAAGSGTVTVNKTSPTVSLSSSVNPLIYGGLSVFTATINGGQSPSGTVTFQVNGQTFGTVTVSGGVAIYNGTNEVWTAGTDTISAIYGGDGDNGGATGTLTETINKATPTVTWATPAAITYGTALSASQLYASSTTAGSFAYTPSAGTVLGAGSQTLAVSFTPTDTTDYNTATVGVTLAVNKASLTITASSPTVTYENSIPTIIPRFSGWIGSDLSSVLTTQPFCTTTYTTSSAAGSSPTTSCSGATAANYSFNYVSGTVTVNQASQAITFTAPASPVTYGASPLALSASSSSGLGVTFTSSGPCFVNSSTLTITGAGTCTVTASQPGNTNYSAATPVPQSITVNQTPTVTTLSSSLSPSTYGQSVTLSALVNTGGATPTRTVTFLEGGTSIGTGSVNAVRTTNLLPNSQQYTSWYNPGVILTPNAIAAPDGTSTGTLMVANSSYYVSTNSYLACAPGSVTVSSWAMNYSSSPAARMDFTLIFFDINNNQLGDYENVQFLSNSWQRYSYTVTAPANTATCWVAQSVLSLAGIPTAGMGEYIWGTQVEQNASAGPYVLTGTSSQAGYGGVATLTSNSLTAGSHSATAMYNGDTNDVSSISSTLTQVVNQVTPGVTTWPTASAITYGQTLASSTLSGGTASVGGTFRFTTPTITPGAGTASQGVIFTPADTANYNMVSGSVSVTITKATPTVSEWPTASAITYGQTLASSTLSGGTPSTPGTFAWTTSATAPGAGEPSESVTFTPTDTTDYNTVTATVTLTVNKATPSTTWATPAAITYGTALSATQLNASSTTAGAFVYTPATGTVLTAGSHTLSVTITPTDTTDYNTATQTVPLIVNKATPTITWATPAAITYGTVLSVAQLDATSGGVAGSFAYTPAAGTVLGVGSQTLSVTFTPSDTTDYNTATGSVTLQVIKGSVFINSTSSLNSSVYGDSVTWTFTFVGGGITPTGTTTIKDGAVTLATVGLNAGNATYTTSALVAGSHTLTAVYSGDNKYQ